MDKLQRARTILAAQYNSIKLNALAAAVLLGKYDNKPEMKAVLAALNAPYPAQEAVAWLSKDDAQLALFQAIQAIKLGNPTDDKMILANLREAGLWIGRYAAAPVAAAPVDQLETMARQMFEAQADKLAAPWNQQWEPTKENWRKKAAAALKASTPAAPGIDLRNAILQLREDALHMKDPGDTVNAYNRVLALIDANPTIGKRPKALQ